MSEAVGERIAALASALRVRGVRVGTGEVAMAARALAAVELHAPELEGAVFLCGNAPLALAGVVVAIDRK